MSQAPGAMTGRPLPVPDEQTAPFWEAAAREVLTLARCTVCGVISHPPDVICSHCGTTSPEFLFTPADGRGAIRSWTVIRQSFLPGFDVPFVLVDVELDVQTDLRLIGRLLDGPDVALTVGGRVELAFEALSPEFAVPSFRLEAKP